MPATANRIVEWVKTPRKTKTVTGQTRRWRSTNSDLVVIEIRSDYGLPKKFLVARTVECGEVPVSSHRTRSGAVRHAQEVFRGKR